MEWTLYNANYYSTRIVVRLHIQYYCPSPVLATIAVGLLINVNTFCLSLHNVLKRCDNLDINSNNQSLTGKYH